MAWQRIGHASGQKPSAASWDAARPPKFASTCGTGRAAPITATGRLCARHPWQVGPTGTTDSHATRKAKVRVASPVPSVACVAGQHASVQAVASSSRRSPRLTWTMRFVLHRRVRGAGRCSTHTSAPAPQLYFGFREVQCGAAPFVVRRRPKAGKGRTARGRFFCRRRSAQNTARSLLTVVGLRGAGREGFCGQMTSRSRIAT